MPSIYDFSDWALEKQIGEFLRDVRIKNNLTQLEAARLSGVHRNTVSSIEGGAGGTVSTLVQLLRTYKHLHLIEPMKPLPTELSPIQLWKLQQKRKRKVKHRVKK
jgi:transcriptional regulator with XRE-family HTH domain